MLEEFKKFLIKGNAVDMAVGFIFGAAFAGVVKSFIANVIMPPIGLLMGNVDFSQLFISLKGDYSTLKAAEEAGAPVIKYGLAITDIINFVILGFVIFLMVKAINNMQKKEEEKPEEPKGPTEIELLQEIAESLKK
jgi:large conductance mechanosensitive channel